VLPRKIFNVTGQHEEESGEEGVTMERKERRESERERERC
jgi:hypothetical protein